MKKEKSFNYGNNWPRWKLSRRASIRKNYEVHGLKEDPAILMPENFISRSS